MLNNSMKFEDAIWIFGDNVHGKKRYSIKYEIKVIEMLKDGYILHMWHLLRNKNEFVQQYWLIIVVCKDILWHIFVLDFHLKNRLQRNESTRTTKVKRDLKLLVITIFSSMEPTLFVNYIWSYKLMKITLKIMDFNHNKTHSYNNPYMINEFSIMVMIQIMFIHIVKILFVQSGAHLSFAMKGNAFMEFLFGGNRRYLGLEYCVYGTRFEIKIKLGIFNGFVNWVIFQKFPENGMMDKDGIKQERGHSGSKNRVAGESLDPVERLQQALEFVHHGLHGVIYHHIKQVQG